MIPSIKSDIKNRRVFIRLRSSKEIVEQSIRAGFFLLGADLKRTSNREILRKPKSGNLYIIRTRSGRRRRHIASAPGETHANLSGKLRKSIGWQVHGFRRMTFGYGVGSRGAGLNDAPDYAAAIEFGSARIKARPSLANAINSTERNAEIYFSKRFEL